AELGQCRADLERLQSSSGSLEQAKAALEAELQERQATMEALEGRLRQVKEALQAREEAKASVELELQRAKEAEAKLTEELEQSTATVSAAEEAKAELTRKLQDMADHLRDLETKKGEVEAELQSYRAASEKEQKSTKEVSREDLEWLPTFWEEDEDETGGQVEAQPGGPEQAQAALEALEDQLRRTQGAAEARQEAKASVEERLQRAEEAESAVWAELQQAQAAVLAAEETNAALAAKVEESKDAVEAAERFKADLQPSLESFKDRILALEAQLQSGDQPVQEAGRGAGEGNGGDDVHGRSWTCCAKRRPQEATSMEELGFRLEGLTRRASTWNRARTQAEAKMEILAASAAAAEQRLQEAKEEGQTAMVELAQSQAELRTATAAEAAAAVRLAQSEAASAAAEEAKAELTAEVRESKDAVAAAERFKADLQKALANLKDRILALEAELPALEEPEASERGSAGVQDEGGDPVSMVGLSAWCARRRAQEVVSIEELGSRLEGLTKRARSWERGKAEVEARMEILAASATAAEQHLQEAKEEGQTAAAELAQCQDELQKAKETEAALTAELQQSKAAAAASEEAKAELAAELRESKDAVEAAKRFKADLQPGLASLKDRILALELRLPDEPAQARASLRISLESWGPEFEPVRERAGLGQGEAAAKSRRFSLSCCGQRRRSQEAGSVEELGNRLQALVQRLDALKRDKSEAEARLFATSAAVTALEKQLAAEAEVEDEFEALPPFWEEKERKPMDAAAQVRLQSLEVANVDLGHQLRQSKEESQAAQVQLQKAKETEAALEFELEQSKAALAAAEADKAELTDDLQESQDAVQAAEHFKADLQPGLESFKDRILALEAQLGRMAASGSPSVSGLEELPTFGEEEQEQVEASEGGGATISNVRLQSLADANADLGRQLQQAKEESQAAQAQLQKAKEMEQDSKNAAEAAERFKADLQPSLESFKDRILALEAQLQSGDQTQAAGGQGAPASSARRCWSLCARRRTQEAASIEELGVRLEDKAEAEAKAENSEAHAAALEEQVRRFQAREEATASAEAQLQEAKETEAALTAELEQSKAAASAAEAKVQESRADLEAAERFKADLRPGLESFKDRILALEAQLPDDQRTQVGSGVEEALDEGEAAAKSRRFSLSCCGHRRQSQEAASVAQLGNRLQALAQRLDTLKRGKSEAEARLATTSAEAAALDRQLAKLGETASTSASVGDLPIGDLPTFGENEEEQVDAREGATGSNVRLQSLAAANADLGRQLQQAKEESQAAQAQLQKAKGIEAALMAELEQSKAAVSAAEKAKADLEAADRFKADLQPSLESFKGRILALEAELESGDQLAQEASLEELGFRLQGVAERLHALKQNKAEVEASSGSLEQAKAALEAELQQAQAAVSAAEEAKAELAAKVQESKDAAEAAERFKAQLQPSLQSFEDQISVLEAQLPKPVQAHCACCLLAAMFGAARFGQVVQISSANQPVQAPALEPKAGSSPTTAVGWALSLRFWHGKGTPAILVPVRVAPEAASIDELGARLQARRFSGRPGDLYGLVQQLGALRNEKVEAEVKLENSAAHAAALEDKVREFQAREEATATAEAQLQEARETEAALTAELEQSKAAVSAAEANAQESKADLEAAERFKADLQPGLESFKDRILALEAQLPGNHSEVGSGAQGAQEGEAAAKSRRFSLSCCGHRRRSQEVASVEDLGNRLQALAQRLDTLKRGKSEAEAQLATTSAMAAALEQQLAEGEPTAASGGSNSVLDLELPSFEEEPEAGAVRGAGGNVKLRTLAAANADLGRQLQQAKEESQAAQAQLQRAKETDAALTAELQRSKAAVSAAEEAKADLEAAERFKADLQPSLESFKDRILALEAQLPGDSEQAQAQVDARDAEDSQVEGEAGLKPHRSSFSCCMRRRPAQEVASLDELGFRLQGVAERLSALTQGKAEVEAELGQCRADLEKLHASSGSLEQAKAALEAELEQSKAAVSAAEEAKADLEAAERFKADLQPSLESFKDRILALEAQLPGDQPAQAEARGAEDGQDEGEGSGKSRHSFFSCCARRRPQEAASMEELGNRLQVLVQRLDALKQGKAEAEAQLASTSAVASALEQQLTASNPPARAAASASAASVQDDFMALPTFGEDEEQPGAAAEISNVRLQSLAAANSDLGRQLQQSKAEHQAAQAELQKAKEAEAALMAKLEQSKAVVSAAEEAQADLEAAERFKADLQPGLESFKDRILALEAQLSGDQPTEAEVRGAEDGQDEGASAKSRRRSFSCCARRQSQDILRRDCELGRAVGTEVKEACIQASGQEAASVEELGFRLQGVVERLNALKQGKAEAEVAATTLGQQLQQSQEECTAAKGQLQQMKDALEAREEAKASVEAQLQKAEAGTAQDGQDEGASKPRGRSFSCCARRRSQDSCGEMGGLGRKEAASVEELGFRLQARDAELLRLQGVATRLKALKQGKAEVEAKMESTAVSATALEQQLQQSQEEFNAAKAELGQCHAELQQLRTSSSSLEQAKAALEAELEQSKAAVSIAEEAKADLEAAERFKADLQPSLESFKDRILALEAQLPGDQRSGCQVAPLLVVLLRETPEVAAVEELGNRLQALVQRLDALKRSKAEAEAQLATTSAVAAALEQQLVKPGERVDMALPTFGEDEEQGATVPEISNVRLQSLAAASAALGRQLRQSQEEAQAAQAQLQRATAELEQSKAAVSAAEEAKADLAAAERFKADLQPGLESFKDRILALEAQLEIGDQPAEAEVRADEGQDEGGAAVKSRRRSLSCCARRRPQDSL
ncbi:unnamed protein product, partial [Effrenium voratum]